jgi:hypothetical protein
MVDQRSYIYCTNTNQSESQVYFGSGATAGTQNYNRANVSIANGVFAGGTTLSFEMRAWRTYTVAGGCITSENRILNNTWSIILHYSDEIETPNIGINDSSPVSSLDINGKLKIGDDFNNPVEGMIRYNYTTQDFEGYNGEEWLSLTKRNVDKEQIITTPKKVYTGESEFDFLGGAIATDNNYCMIGKGKNSDFEVIILHKSNNVWKPLDTIHQQTSDDCFGCSIDMDGQHAIIGAEFQSENSNSEMTGRTYFAQLVNGNWVIIAAIDVPYLNEDARLGHSVAIDEDYALASAINANNGSALAAGKVFVMKYNGSTWAITDTLKPPVALAEDNFGLALDLKGYWAAISDPTNGTTNFGKVYMYKRQSGEWILKATLTHPTPIQNGYFGNKVAMDEDELFISAIGHNNGFGEVRYYKLINNSWIYQYTLTSGDEENSHYFGEALTFSEGKLLISDVGAEVYGEENAGKVYLFEKINNIWQKTNTYHHPSPSANDYFGEATSMMANDIFISTPSRNRNGSTQVGEVLVFRK